jgi:uncharacterized membrane protein
VRVVDELVRAQRPERRQAELASVLLVALRAAWGVRVELLVLLSLVVLYQRVAGVLGSLTSAVVLAVVVACGLARRPARRAALDLLRAMHVRRRWERATIDAGAAEGPLRCPGVHSVTRVPAGDLLRVRVRRGQSVSALEIAGRRAYGGSAGSSDCSRRVASVANESMPRSR